jgi:hypothetical protein
MAEVGACDLFHEGMIMAIFMHDKDNEALNQLILEAFRNPPKHKNPTAAAVLVYREISGAGLREAIEYVDSVLKNAGYGSSVTFIRKV